MDMLKSAKTYILTAFVIALTCLFTSCDKSLFDDEGDCEVTHIVRFRYDRNLKWADAFPSEVNSVNLYVFDNAGVFVKEYIGRGEVLSSPDYHIKLDLPVGDYKFVAWCGLANERAKEESFTVPQPVPGVTTLDELTCRLNTKTLTRVDGEDAQEREDDEAEYSDRRLYFLYHGALDVNIVDNHDGMHYEHVIYLTKNTNHVRIILQELSSDEGLNPDDYEVCIEAANGVMAYDNELLGGRVVTYRPWAQHADSLGLGKTDVEDGSLKYVKGLVTDLSVGRMMAAHKNGMMLTIKDRNSQENIIARVPIIQYALLSREYYEMAYGHRMTDQEFLDREDEYVLTFFLYNNRWLSASILIHAWRVVLHEYGL